MSLDNVPRCQHLKVNGTQCGSPALRRRRRCYFHDRMLDGRKRYSRERVKPRPVLSMCLLEDANAVQMALMQVLEILGNGQMDYKMAGLMLYGLQIASSNLRHVRFEAEKPTDVVIDRKTMGQTCINGPQWFASDFDEKEDDKQDDKENDKQEEPETSDTIAASAAQVASKAVSAEAESGQAPPVADRPDNRRARRARARAQMRKRPARAESEEAPSIVRDLYYKMFPNGPEPELDAPQVASAQPS